MDRTVLVALGSNLGDSTQTILDAFDALEKLSRKPIRRSSLWQTTPVNCPPGSPPFVNAAVALTPLQDETPESLLIKLQQIEKEFGRRPKLILNEPRPLDLDLVSFGDEVRNTPALTLPHPRAHERRFVLSPLSEVAPEFVLPGQARTVKELLSTTVADPLIRQLP
jgi:2-amino-4-hydroxy-6-hydroxymethyldihydropteridine diphosphokinase